LEHAQLLALQPIMAAAQVALAEMEKQPIDQELV